jgi:hypothetical protein
MNLWLGLMPQLIPGSLTFNQNLKSEMVQQLLSSCQSSWVPPLRFFLEFLELFFYFFWILQVAAPEISEKENFLTGPTCHSLSLLLPHTAPCSSPSSRSMRPASLGWSRWGKGVSLDLIPTSTSLSLTCFLSVFLSTELHHCCPLWAPSPRWPELPPA